MFKFLVNRYLFGNMQFVLSADFTLSLVNALAFLVSPKQGELALLLSDLLATTTGKDGKVLPSYATLTVVQPTEGHAVYRVAHPMLERFVYAVVNEEVIQDLYDVFTVYCQDQRATRSPIPTYLFAFYERVGWRLEERQRYYEERERAPQGYTKAS